MNFSDFDYRNMFINCTQITFETVQEKPVIKSVGFDLFDWDENEKNAYLVDNQ